jgi:hypothetical protein
VTPSRARGEIVVATWVIALALPFLGKAWHVDEPFFLAIADNIRTRPLAPLAFDFNWYGSAVPMSQINNTPPIFSYLLAAVTALSRGSEWWTRALLLPLDAAAAVALYKLAARFLRQPLGPCLALLAAPAWTLNMGHAMPEKLLMPLGLWGLYLLLTGLETASRARVSAAGLLLGAALLAKYAAVAFLPAAAILLLSHGWSGAGIAFFGAAAGSGLAFYLGWDFLHGSRALGAATRTLAASRLPWHPGKIRAVLAFLGGGSIAAFWAPWAYPSRLGTLAAALAAAFLFSAGANWADRLLGGLFAGAAAWTLCALFSENRTRDGRFLLAWVSGALFVQALVYWSVLARVTMLALPPLAIGLAKGLERRFTDVGLRRIYWATVAASVVVTMSLGAVDFAYARAQRWMAYRAAALAAGRPLWYSGHWGWQRYMQNAGARPIDLASGGWRAVRAGDVAIVPAVNANVILPDREILALRQDFVFNHPIPLRLISGFGGQAGFYSDVFGFLPFAISREPLERFSVLEVR